MKPKRKQPPPPFQGVGVVPITKSEYLKRDIIHQHMVSHYRRLYNAKSDVDTSPPQYFKPMFRPRPRPALPKPSLPVKTTLTKQDKDHIESWAMNRGPWWPPGDTSRFPIRTTEEFVESIMMSVEERPPVGKRKKAKIQQCRRIESLSVSPAGRKNNFMAISPPPVSQSTSRLSNIGFPASSRLREMSIYHPPRRRTQPAVQKKERKERKSSYAYCSGCLAKFSKSEHKGKSKITPEEKKICVSRAMELQKEDLKYLQFIQDITQDILRNDAYTDECLEMIFRKHIIKNFEELKLNRMKEEIKKLKVQLDMPCRQALHPASSSEDDIFHGFSDPRKEINQYSQLISEEINEHSGLNSEEINEHSGLVSEEISKHSRPVSKEINEHFRVISKDNIHTETDVKKIQFWNHAGGYRESSPVNSDLELTYPYGVSKVTAVKKVDSPSQADEEVKEISAEANNGTSDEGKVISFLEYMGFNQTIAQEICDCMSNRDLMNLQIPFDSEDKKWVEKLDEYEALNFDALSKDDSETEDSRGEFQTYHPPSSLFGEGDAKLEHKHLSNNSAEQMKKEEKTDDSGRASGDGPFETSAANAVDTKRSEPASGPPGPGVPSPVGSDYSSMKDHDDDEEEEDDDDDDDDESRYESSLDGEEADEGRESAPEDEDIPEDISVSSTASGVSQLVREMKSIAIRESNRPQNELSPCRVIET